MRFGFIFVAEDDGSDCEGNRVDFLLRLVRASMIKAASESLFLW